MANDRQPKMRNRSFRAECEAAEARARPPGQVRPRDDWDYEFGHGTRKRGPKSIYDYVPPEPAP
jgi:hypothetical protein